MTPMLQLGTILHSKGFSIVIAHPEFNSPNPSNYPEFSYLPLPDKLSNVDTSFYNTLAVISALNINCRAPLQEHLVQMMEKGEPHDRLSCIIYDPIMHFSTVVANNLKLPSMILRTSSASDLVAYNAIPHLDAQGYFPLQGTGMAINFISETAVESTDDTITDSLMQDLVPNLHPLRFKDLPIAFYESFMLELFGALTELRTSSAIIWNTIDYLEHSSLLQLQQHYQVPCFSIGPLHKIAPALSTSFLREDTSCIAWLDKQAPSSVIYVSLGSIALIDKEELAETAWGLANSKQPFLWVIRPGSVNGSEWIELLPKGFQEIVGERGCIVKWAPQKEVLRHPAVRGFWSHCGWNSTLECISEGVPMICNPYFADQNVNARYLTHVWKIGVELGNPLERGEIKRAILRVMAEKEGEEMRQRAIHMKEKVEVCLQNGGSSYNSLNDLTEFILSFNCR